VFCDLAVMLADGGRCVSDLAALAGQPSLFGEVASVSTARRVVLSVGPGELDRIRQARAMARARAWATGAAPAQVILDFDAMPITSHSARTPSARAPTLVLAPGARFTDCRVMVFRADSPGC
jgi:hypothetical protein